MKVYRIEGGILLIFCPCFFVCFLCLPGIEPQVTQICSLLFNASVVLHSVIRPRVDDFRYVSTALSSQGIQLRST
jgi:hypothetical protein